MKNVIGLVAVAGLAATAFGQPVETRLEYQARVFNAGHNNGWVGAGGTLEALPGDQIEVRAVVSYTGSSNVFGLGQIIFQPVVDDWTAGDSVIGTPGTPGNQGIGPTGSNTSTPPGYVADAPGVYGRISPWAGANTTTSNFYRGHVHNNPDGSGNTYLRIARNDVTNWIGVGASSGSGAANNTSGAGGVTVAQGTIGAGRPTNFPPQNNNLQNLVVFKFGFLLSSATADRTLDVTTPAAGIGRSTAASSFGQPDTRWYSAADQTAPGLYRTDVEVVAAHIHVVPTPASLALMGLGGLMVARRRR